MKTQPLELLVRMKNAAVSRVSFRSSLIAWVHRHPGSLLTAAGLALALLDPGAQAQPNPNPPERLTYQGFLVDGNGVALGNTAPKNYDLEFRLFNHETDSGGANLLWGEQQTVTVDKGYFSVLLGEGAMITGVPHPDLSTLFRGATASERWIGITVKGIGAGGANVNILPRLRLLSSPYAFLASQAVKVVRSDTGNDLISSSANAVTVNGTVTAESFAGHGTIPVGGIIMWSGATVPPGWALCNGQNGTPDLRGRFVLGAGAGTGLTARNIGQAGGAETHTLTIAEMPAHTHSFRTFHANFGHVGSATEGSTKNDGDGVFYDADAVQSTGGGEPHHTMPPYYVLAYIMRVQ